MFGSKTLIIRIVYLSYILPN